jgi:glucose/arabinose dehydrogenase
MGLLVSGLALMSCSTKPPEPKPQPAPAPARTDVILTGADALGDWTTDAPGVKRKITAADLPAPNENESVRNSPKKAARPAGASPKVPPGFTVGELALDLKKPRVVQVAPNGDIFVVESDAGRVQLLRDGDSATATATARPRAAASTPRI